MSAPKHHQALKSPIPDDLIWSTDDDGADVRAKLEAIANVNETTTRDDNREDRETSRSLALQAARKRMEQRFYGSNPVHGVPESPHHDDEDLIPLGCAVQHMPSFEVNTYVLSPEEGCLDITHVRSGNNEPFMIMLESIVVGRPPRARNELGSKVDAFSLYSTAKPFPLRLGVVDRETPIVIRFSRFGTPVFDPWLNLTFYGHRPASDEFVCGSSQNK